MLLLLALLGAVSAAPTLSPYAYSDTFARSKILPMCAATDSSKPIDCLKNHFPAPQLKRHYNIACDKYKLDRCVGYSAVDHSDQAILLAFRGTEGDLQWVLESEETVFGNHTAWVGGGLVSRYFAEAFMAIWNGGMKNDFNYLKNQNKDYQIWIAGHSLGGAMASLAASYIVSTGLADGSSVRLVTFGQPRTGDQDWAAAHDKALPYSYRIVHNNDPIPHVPQQYVEKYHHHKTEVWYKNNMTSADSTAASYEICHEEDSLLCSDSVKKFAFHDHSVYFDQEVWSWGEAGCPNS